MLPTATAASEPAAPATIGTLAPGRGPRRFGLLCAFGAVLVVTLCAGGAVAPAAQDYLVAAARARAALRYDRALTDYALASAASPDFARPQCLAGEVYQLQGEFTAASAAFRRCTTLAPEDAGAWLHLGDALDQGGDHIGARVAWNRSGARGSSTAIRRLALADERDGAFANSIAEWVRLPPHDPQALEHLGLMALSRGDLTTAQANFVAARATPNAFADELVDDGFAALAALPYTSARDFGQLGHAFLSAGMTSLAVAPLRTAIALDPTSGDAHSFLGWAYWQQGDHVSGRREIALGLKLTPTLSFAAYTAGEVATADGNIRGALSLFQRGVETDGHNPVLWAEIGRMDLALRDYPAAEAALANAAAFSHDPLFSIAFVRYYVDYRLGLDDHHAIIAATTAVSRFPDNETLHYLLAKVYDLLVSPSSAYYACQQAIALDPADPGPYVLLGRYAEGRGDLVAAAFYLRTALALRPHGPFAAEARQLLAPIAGISV